MAKRAEAMRYSYDNSPRIDDAKLSERDRLTNEAKGDVYNARRIFTNTTDKGSIFPFLYMPNIIDQYNKYD